MRCPPFDALAAKLREALAADRVVAVHCVTGESLLLTVAVLTEIGPFPGDRIEQAAIALPEAASLLAGLGTGVVTQPSLVTPRGDSNLDRVAADDVDHLWPWPSLQGAGVRVAGSSDAPYRDLDPWHGIRAAVARRSLSGRMVAGHKAVDAATALAGWLTPADDPGGPIRRVVAGVAGDLVLLDVLEAALADPATRHERLALVAGEIVYDRRAA